MEKNLFDLNHSFVQYLGASRIVPEEIRLEQERRPQPKGVHHLPAGTRTTTQVGLYYNIFGSDFSSDVQNTCY